MENLDQGEVGERLGLSRSAVSRILARAKDEGIIEVRIIGDDYVPRNRELEARLMSAYGLREAQVAQTGGAATELRAVAKLGSEVFTRRGASATRIGFGWGLTIGQLADTIPSVQLRPDTHLTPLVGGMPLMDTAPSGNTVIAAVAEKCSLTADRFDAPQIVESAATYHAMRSESSVQAALARARQCDLAFIGIGSFGVRTSNIVLEAMKLNESELAEVLAAEPAGDCVGRFFDIHGTELGPPASERVIGIEIEAIRDIDVAVAVAAGKEKVFGVLGALRTGAFDVAVVDEGLAVALLNQVDGEDIP